MTTPSSDSVIPQSSPPANADGLVGWRAKCRISLSGARYCVVYEDSLVRWQLCDNGTWSNISPHPTGHYLYEKDRNAALSALRLAPPPPGVEEDRGGTSNTSFIDRSVSVSHVLAPEQVATYRGLLNDFDNGIRRLIAATVPNKPEKIKHSPAAANVELHTAVLSAEVPIEKCSVCNNYKPSSFVKVDGKPACATCLDSAKPVRTITYNRATGIFTRDDGAAIHITGYGNDHFDDWEWGNPESPRAVHLGARWADVRARISSAVRAAGWKLVEEGGEPATFVGNENHNVRVTEKVENAEVPKISFSLDLLREILPLLKTWAQADRVAEAVWENWDDNRHDRSLFEDYTFASGKLKTAKDALLAAAGRVK